MRNWFVLGLLALLPACDGSWQLPVQETDGTVRALKAEDVRGQRIFINYWAEWCKPCLTEIPELNRFAAQHKERAILLGRNFDNLQDDALRNAMQKAQMNFPAVTTDPAKTFELPEISNIPVTVVLDDQGRLISTLWGPQTVESLTTELNIQ